MTAYLHKVVYAGQKLGVDRQTTVELVPGLGNQALGELSLEHQHRTPASGHGTGG